MLSTPTSPAPSSQPRPTLKTRPLTVRRGAGPTSSGHCPWHRKHRRTAPKTQPRIQLSSVRSTYSAPAPGAPARSRRAWVRARRSVWLRSPDPGHRIVERARPPGLSLWARSERAASLSGSIEPSASTSSSRVKNHESIDFDPGSCVPRPVGSESQGSHLVGTGVSQRTTSEPSPEPELSDALHGQGLRRPVGQCCAKDFEGVRRPAAAVVGVPLWAAADRRDLATRSHDLDRLLALLPARTHLPPVDDDF